MRTSAALIAIEPATKTADQMASLRVKSGGAGAACACSVAADATRKAARISNDFICSHCPCKHEAAFLTSQKLTERIRCWHFFRYWRNSRGTSGKKADSRRKVSRTQ